VKWIRNPHAFGAGNLGQDGVCAAAACLKVTTPVDLGHALLPRIARAYATTYPAVSLELILTNRVVDLVAEGQRQRVRMPGAYGMKWMSRMLVSMRRVRRTKQQKSS